jgi:DNA-binding NtrC family response regulator
MVSSAGDLGQLARNTSALGKLATNHQMARAVGTRVQQVTESGENLLVATVGKEHVLVVRYTGRSPAIADLRSVIASVSAVLGSGRLMGGGEKKSSSQTTTAEWSAPDPLGRILGVSDLIAASKRCVSEAARHNEPVFVVGEQGSGRSLFARVVHDFSARSAQPFVELDLAGLDADGIEQRLLINGEAMDSADVAVDGTLVFDHVAEMPAELWRTIVSVLKDRSALQPRLTVVMNAAFDNKQVMRRLNGLKVKIVPVPGLRHRSEDVPILVNAFVREVGGADNERPIGLTVGALEALALYEWPGNVAELRQEIVKLVADASPGGWIDVSHLSSNLTAALHTGGGVPLNLESLAGIDLATARAAFEGWMIGRALIACGGNQSKAAKQLGLSRAGLFKKMRKLGL